MDSAELYSDMLVESDLLGYSFSLRSDTFDAAASSDLVGWLAEEFTLRRCNWFASAIATVTGREHHVAFVHPDGRLAHAVAAASPQYDSALKGNGIDILGRRPLATMLSQMNTMNDRVVVEIGSSMSIGDFDEGELEALVDLAGELPWTAGLVRRSAPQPDGQRLREIAYRLGMPEFQEESR